MQTANAADKAAAKAAAKAEEAAIGLPKPKRPLTSFNLFYRYKRQQVLALLSSGTEAAGKDAIAALVAAAPGLERAPATDVAIEGLSQDGRLVLQRATVRALRPPLGVHAVLGKEVPDGFRFDFEHDRLVIDQKTPVGNPSGGGFGPTVQLDDGTLVTSYSWRTADDQIQLEVARWRLPREHERNCK